MDTKGKILQASLQLFNKKGLTDVSIRDIAAELNISDGNLRYHFRTKDELVEALFDQLADEIGNQLHAGVKGGLTIGLMKDLLLLLLKKFYAYRFLLQDLNSILNSHPKTKKKFNRITVERMELVHQMISGYVQLGYLIPEPYPGHYTKLIDNILIISHFFINGSQLFYKGPQKEIVSFYTERIFSLMYPYLTEKALLELKYK
jgi:AcrR family transcriptional regulator